jgi:hypothetical protein
VNEVDLSTKGTWSQEESKMSINILELKAVLLGLEHFQTQLKNQRVSLFSDNSTVVAYIRKQGGTHSPVHCRMTWELLQFCRRENIVLVPWHISRPFLGSQSSYGGALSLMEEVRTPYEKISFNKERGRSNWHPCQAFWRRTRRLTPLGVRLLSLPCRQWLIKLFLTELYVQSGH